MVEENSFPCASLPPPLPLSEDDGFPPLPSDTADLLAPPPPPPPDQEIDGSIFNIELCVRFLYKATETFNNCAV